MNIDAVLIDLDGVLHVGDAPVPGAVEAVEWLRDEGIPFRCVTNTTQRSPQGRRHPAARSRFRHPRVLVLHAGPGRRRPAPRGGRRACHLIATGDVHRDFEEAGIRLVDGKRPASSSATPATGWTYGSMNQAFRLLIGGARLLALERDRYWRDADGLALSAGPFVAGLEYAAGVTVRGGGQALARLLPVGTRRSRGSGGPGRDGGRRRRDRYRRCACRWPRGVPRADRQVSGGGARGRPGRA